MHCPPRIYNFSQLSCKNEMCLSHPSQKQREVEENILIFGYETENFHQNLISFHCFRHQLKFKFCIIRSPPTSIVSVPKVRFLKNLPRRKVVRRNTNVAVKLLPRRCFRANIAIVLINSLRFGSRAMVMGVNSFRDVSRVVF